MGLAASQVRFLQLTSRRADIGRQLQHLSLEKMALTRDVQGITKDYQAALSSKTLKWSNNAGVNYTDISYNTLMYPNEFNAKSPVLITNNSGKVVINDKYKKYAEMISPDGSAGGVYQGETREKILQDLLGITPDKLQSYNTTANSVETTADVVNKALEERSAIEKKAQTLDSDNFIKQFLSASKLGLSGVKVNAENIDQYAKVLENAILGKDYFTEEQEKAIKDAFTGTNKTVDALKNEFKKDTKEISIEDFISSFVGSIKAALGNSDEIKIMADRDGNGLQSAYDAADKKYKDALEVYNKAIDANNQVYTAEQQTQIDYYDDLFTSIVDNGWSYDGSVDNSEYLSQMFQNNQYYITTIEKNDCGDANKPGCTRIYDYTYSTDLASNFKNIYLVNDSDAREEALVDYEYKKGILNAKEARIDTRMKNLETEDKSIAKMLESIQKVAEDNIENTMKLWA